MKTTSKIKMFIATFILTASSAVALWPQSAKAANRGCDLDGVLVGERTQRCINGDIFYCRDGVWTLSGGKC